MDYRLATENDAKELIRLRLEYLKEDLGTVTKEHTERLNTELIEYYRKHLGKDLIVYVATQNEEIIATAYLLIIEMPASPNFITGKVGDILSVYTEKKYRHKGIGSKLIEYLVYEAEQKELSYIELLATKDGYPLYKKKGFTDHISKYDQMRYYIRK